jgi:hypothetical protein
MAFRYIESYAIFDLFIIKLREIRKIAEIEPYRKKRRMEERKGDGLNLPQFDGLIETAPILFNSLFI